jgi:hypothetical protein
MENKDRKASLVLGILSICLCWVWFVGLTLGIIGISIRKSEAHKTRDRTLNIVGIVLSSVLLLSLLYQALIFFMYRGGF